MQRKVKKVFRALSKKGMTRAFVETGKSEYVYPLITQSVPKKNLKKRYIILPIIICLLIIGILVLNLLLKDKPISQKNSPDFRDRYGMTALHHAVIQAEMDTIKRLIIEGAAIDSKDNYGWTPLHWAVFKQDEKICRHLINSGASIYVSTTRSWFKFPGGITVLEMAKITQNEIIQAILVRGEIKNKQ
jgi:ankyrin repeat protein